MAEFVFTILYHPFPWWFRLWKICLQYGIEKIPAEGHGNPLQYSCLENPWTDEPSGLESIWSQKFWHDWVTNTRIYYVTTFEILSYPKHQKGMRCAPKGPWNLFYAKCPWTFLVQAIWFCTEPNAQDLLAWTKCFLEVLDGTKHLLTFHH